LPACVASIVHEPAATSDATDPETVQALVVLEEKLTLSPDDAVAANATVAPTIWSPGLAKLIVCDRAEGAVSATCEAPQPANIIACKARRALIFMRLMMLADDPDVTFR
jgi:hypothetical protein